MTFWKKLTAFLTALIMVFTMIPFFTSAAESESSGTFKCAWFNETLTYPYEYSDDYFLSSPDEYNHELARFALCVSMASFNSFDKEKGDEHIKAMLENCGFEVFSYGYETEGYDTVGVAFGRKQIYDYNVIIAAVRSGNYGMEWGGNLRVGSDGDHEGFTIAKNILIGYMNQYFEEHPCEGKTKILIPGYSRGGSITNLTAAALDDGSYAEALGTAKDNIAAVDFDLYAYTFEAPQCTTSKNVKEETYSNIFNIVNPNDYVPIFVMDEWGFSNYGKRIEMPCADNCDNYDRYYDRVCAEFDSYMGENGRKAKNCFYNEEKSRSVETTLNLIFDGLGDDVMNGRESYHENFESSIVFFTGQYLGKKRKVTDFARTMGFIALGTAIAARPSNIEKIKSDGYRKYIAEYLAKNNGGELAQKDIEGTLNLITALLEYINANRKDVVSLAEQLNTVLQVHQPFIALSWMRALNEDDIKTINGDVEPVLKLSCTSMTLKYDVNGKIVPRYDETLGHIEWKSDNDSIVSVNEKGIVHGNSNGTANVTATLISESGVKIAESTVAVTIKMNAVEMVMNYLQQIFKN